MKFENTQVGDEVIICKIDRGMAWNAMNTVERLAVVTHATSGLLVVEGKKFMRRNGSSQLSSNWHIKPKTEENMRGLEMFKEKKKARQLAN